MNQHSDPAIDVSPIHTATLRALQTAAICPGSRNRNQISMITVCIATTAASVTPARTNGSSEATANVDPR